MTFELGSSELRIATLGFLGASAGLLAYAVGSGDTIASKLHARYVAHLDAKLRRLFRPELGRRIAALQGAALAVLLAARLASEIPLFPLWLVVVAAGPELYLLRACAERIARLESQIDGFVVALANALKTVPSPAAALQATTMILPQPIRQEIEQVLKEVRIGSTLETALLAMSARVKSQWVDVAFSAVLIGLRVGGNLPGVLERTASMIREMNRLLGVVRSRTSEGRAQLWVLALFPVFVVAAFELVQPGYFDPLRSSFVGQLCVGAAGILWIASLLLGRKIMAVDV
ncbi:MAG TPA: type II secretion system F family protein [Labilithrix sp.]|nr:type II secretion system F family protein [Labilithrix sp.]